MMHRHRHHRAPLPVRNIARSMALVGLTLVACSDNTPSHLGSESSAVFKGADSPATDDFVVQVQRGTNDSGTGFLAAPNVVITAAHIVANSQDFTYVGVQNCRLGTVPDAPSAFSVFVGQSFSSGHKYLVKRVFYDTAQTSCEHDIAALELTTNVTEVTAFPALRLDSAATLGEQVKIVGYGVVNDQSSNPTNRQTEMGTVIETGGGSITDPTGSVVPVPLPFIGVDVDPCPGDSGSPLLDVQGAVMAAVPANTSSATGGGLCENRYGIAIPLSVNAPFIERVFQAEGLMPHREGQAPPADLGGACSVNNQCNSNYCIQVGGQGTCSKPCAAATDCPSNFTCTDTGRDLSVCLAPSGSPNAPSCAASKSRGDNGGVIALFASLLGLAITRRRKGRSLVRRAP